MKALTDTLGLVLGLLIFAALWLVVTTLPGQAGPHCAKRATIVTVLADRYGETPRGIGLAANRSVLEIFASAETGTWTATATKPDGLTCLVASGQGWQDIAPTVVPPGTEG